MKKTIAMMLLFVMAVTFIFGSTALATEAKPEITIVLSDINNADSVLGQASQRIADLIFKKSGLSPDFLLYLQMKILI